MLLPDSPLSADLTGDEIREALRSLKGAMLHQEVYALDSSDGSLGSRTASPKETTRSPASSRSAATAMRCS